MPPAAGSSSESDLPPAGATDSGCSSVSVSVLGVAALRGLPVDPRVEGVFEGVHALGTGRGEQPPRHHLALLSEFDPADSRPQVDVDGGLGVEPPRSGAAVGGGAAIGRCGRIGHQPPIREHDRPVRKPQVGVEIEAAGGHDLLARLQFKPVASPRTWRLPFDAPAGGEAILDFNSDIKKAGGDRAGERSVGP
jgi:hypothetical protein